MAHRHIYNTSQIFDAESDQHWNLLHSEDPYHRHARSSSAESTTIFHPADNGPANRAHYVSPWNTARPSGYPSSGQMANAPHYQPDSSDLTHDFVHPSAAGNAFIVPERHAHHPSSSYYGVESNFLNISMGNGRGPYKRKRPGIPDITERGSTSSYYCAGSSSDAATSSAPRQEKSTVDTQLDHWEALPSIGGETSIRNVRSRSANYRTNQQSIGGETSTRNVRRQSANYTTNQTSIGGETSTRNVRSQSANYRTNQPSIGGETSTRNVRSQFTLDLESDAFRPHLPANHAHHPSPSAIPVDHFGTIDSFQNQSVPLPQRTPIHVPVAPVGRTVVPSNLNHESNQLFSGSSIMAGYHHEHIASINSLSQSLHPTPSHTRGVRSSYSHRSASNCRVAMGNLRMSHVAPSNDGLQLPGENHATRHQRPFGPIGWHNGSRSGRSRYSSERYRLFSEDAGEHDRLTPEGLMVIDHSLYGSRNFSDQHRDMRLDVDNMSYEELLALGERIGSVNIGLREDQLPKCLTETVYCSSDQVQEEGRCVICLEEYEHMDDIGTLKTCGHDYHVSCIKKWLSMKNTCPICKGPAVPDNVKET
ncbi:unnamed protein product [Amaranthus hypochondriacus]